MRGLVTVRGEGCKRQIDRAWPKVPCSVPWEVGGGERTPGDALQQSGGVSVLKLLSPSPFLAQPERSSAS